MSALLILVDCMAAAAAPVTKRVYSWQPHCVIGRTTALCIQVVVFAGRIFDQRLSFLTRWAHFVRVLLIIMVLPAFG